MIMKFEAVSFLQPFLFGDAIEECQITSPIEGCGVKRLDSWLSLSRIILPNSWHSLPKAD